MGRIKIHLRSFVSFLVTLSFVLAAMSGIVLLLAPRGQGGRWTNWAMWRLSRHEWRDVHAATSFLFTAGAAVHLLLNWRALRGYVRGGANRRWGPRLAGLLGALTVCGVLAATIAQLGPFASLTSRGEGGPNRGRGRGSSAQTVTELADGIGARPGEVVEALRAEGFAVEGPEARIEDIARSNNASRQAVYSAVEKHYPEARPWSGRRGGQGGGRGGQGWRGGRSGRSQTDRSP